MVGLSFDHYRDYFYTAHMPVCECMMISSTSYQYSHTVHRPIRYPPITPLEKVLNPRALNMDLIEREELSTLARRLPRDAFF